MPSPAMLEGPVHAVPCPSCGKSNDFREIAENIRAASSFGEQTDHGQIVLCDHCDQRMEIAGVFVVTVIKVRQPQ